MIKMKKALKIIGIIMFLLLIAIITLPILFKGTFEEKIKYLANEHLEAKIDFSSLDISLLKSFPKSSITIEDFSVINKVPFEGDTLAYAKKITLQMALNQLFKGTSESIAIQKFALDEALITVKTDSLGNSNLDITKTNDSTSAETSENGGSFTFDLEHYEINHATINYIDEVSKTRMSLNDVNHSGDGSLSGEKIILDTHTDTKASVSLDNTSYLTNNHLQLDAEIELDLNQQRYTFLENKALINQLAIEFDGFVQLLETQTNIDLTFKTPTTDFKNFLALIPQTYSKDLDGVQTTGDFSVNGVVKGKLDDKHIPTIDIKIASHDASFKYPELPKSVTHINIDTQIKNETGLVDDTFIKIGNTTFRIDEDTFVLQGELKNITKNMLVDMKANGTLNLANLNKAYPMNLDHDLNGILNANINTQFDTESLEKEKYQNVKTSGAASIREFAYTSPELQNPLYISKAKVSFTPQTIALEEMDVTTGKSDIQAKGTIENFMGFLFTNQDLKGTFDVSSTIFTVNDFMVSDETEGKGDPSTSIEEEALKIPSFLNATLNFYAKKVIYDNLELKDTKGTVVIKDEKASLKNVTSNIFNGGLAFNGNVSTKKEKPLFEMSLDLKKIDIVQSFNNLELLQALSPIAKALTGDLTTQINLNGNLQDDLTPALTSLKGSALAEIFNAKVSTSKTPLLSKLDSKTNFVQLEKLNLKTIKTNVSFDDGKVIVKPFNFEVGDLKVQAQGNHSFEKNLDYTLSVDVPAKRMGKEVTTLLVKLDPKEAENISATVPIGVSGNFTNPKINVDIKQAVGQLTQQIMDKQKKKVKDKLIDKGTKVLGGLLGGGDNASTQNDTEQTEANNTLSNTAKNVLGGLLGKKKTQKDSTNN